MKNPSSLRSAPLSTASIAGYNDALWSTHILHADDGMAMAEVGPVCVIIWREGMTKIRIARLRHGLTNFLTRYAEGAAVMCILEPAAKPPEDGTRQELSNIVRSSQGSHLICMAYVIEGTGFRLALARSVIFAISRLIARKHNVSCFQSVDMATTWMSRHLAGMPCQRFLESVDRIRSAIH